VKCVGASMEVGQERGLAQADRPRLSSAMARQLPCGAAWRRPELLSANDNRAAASVSSSRAPMAGRMARWSAAAGHAPRHPRAAGPTRASSRAAPPPAAPRPPSTSTQAQRRAWRGGAPLQPALLSALPPPAPTRIFPAVAAPPDAAGSARGCGSRGSRGGDWPRVCGGEKWDWGLGERLGSGIGWPGAAARVFFRPAGSL
jgi:hypothetical protein